MRRDRHLALIQGYHVGKRAGRIEAEREIAESLDALRREMHVRSERMTATLLDEIRTLRAHLAETRMELHRRNLLDLAEHAERDLAAPLN